MMTTNYHNFWKEALTKSDRVRDTWSKRKKERPEQGRMMYERPRKVILYAPLPNEKMVKQRPLILTGAGDFKRPKRGFIKRQDKRLKRYPDPMRRNCNRCQMIEFEGRNSREPEKCQTCKGVVTYHCFRCCICGCEPLDPRMFLWDETPKMEQYDYEQYLSDDEEMWNDF